MNKSGPIIFVLALVMISQTLFADTPTLPEGIILLDKRPAPVFHLTDLDGNTYTMKGATGNWHFVHFWASWCGPCRREMPAIQRMIEQMRETTLKVVLINTAETEDTAFSFLASVAPELNSLLDEDGLVTEQWQPRGLPSTYLVDPAGQIRFIALGERAWDKPEYLNFLKALNDVM